MFKLKIMKKSHFYFILFIVSLFSVVSCNKTEQVIEESLPPMATLLKKIQRIEGAKGGLTISTGNFFSFYNPSAKRVYQIDGGFADLPFEKIKIGNEVTLIPYEKIDPSVSSNQYWPDKESFDDNKFKNLFGKQINIQYENKSTTLNSRVDIMIETPAELGAGVTGNSPNNFYRNVPITWAAGNSSDKVYVLMSFMPTDISNENFSSYPKVTKFYEVPDNGSFTLTESNFQNIPQGASVLIIVARGNTALGAASVNGGKTSVTSMSTTTISGQVGSSGGGGTGGGTGGGDGPGIHIL
jgi:hypothetical protein